MQEKLGYNPFCQVYGHFYGGGCFEHCIVQAFQVNCKEKRLTTQALFEIILASKDSLADDFAIAEGCRKELEMAK